MPEVAPPEPLDCAQSLRMGMARPNPHLIVEAAGVDD